VNIPVVLAADHAGFELKQDSDGVLNAYPVAPDRRQADLVLNIQATQIFPKQYS
jgi:hypothetical protein